MCDDRIYAWKDTMAGRTLSQAPRNVPSEGIYDKAENSLVTN
jgi:hypothetical protein